MRRSIGKMPRLCPTGKHCYMTAQAAEAELKQQRKVPKEWHKKGVRPTAKYHCTDGGFSHFHLTTMRPAVFAERATP